MGIRISTLKEFAQGEEVRVVYSPATDAERERRVARTNTYTTPFLTMPDRPSAHRVLFVTPDGHKVRRDTVEMVYNDMLFCDHVSNNGEDGPLYKDTLQDDNHRLVYEYAMRAYGT